jgi:hypothetical protein
VRIDWTVIEGREPDKASEPKERVLDLQRIVADLKTERDRIIRAISALVGSAAPRGAKKTRVGAPHQPNLKRKKRGGITPEGRQRLSLGMKKRWAERRKKS